MNKYLFYPYLILLFAFLYYSIFIFETIEEEHEKNISSGGEGMEFTWDITTKEFWIIN